MSTWFKQGVWGDLTDEMWEALRKLGRLYSNKHTELYVTSIRDGSHRPDSFHPSGRAIDIRKCKLVTAYEIKFILGNDFDVVEESTHYHIEHDPKD
jgi:hypothetical protein